MTRDLLYHVLYLFLYTVFWCALAAIAYQAFFADHAVRLEPGPFAFMTGMLYFVCAGFRALGRKQERDPILHSFAVSGVLLILFANLCG